MAALNPDTGLKWIVARLRARTQLLSLLGGSFVFQSGFVPGAPPAAFVVVKPPSSSDLTIYAERFPQTMRPRFLVWAETRSDRLPSGKSLDDVLTALQMEIQEALLGVSNPNSPTGGLVHSCNITGFHTPLAMPLNADVQVQQKGVIVELLSS